MLICIGETINYKGKKEVPIGLYNIVAFIYRVEVINIDINKENKGYDWFIYFWDIYL